MSLYTLRDTEDGEPLYVVEYENRRDGDGKRLGPKPPNIAKMLYDSKQIACPVEPRVPEADVSGHALEE